MALLVGHVGFGDAQHAGGRADVDVDGMLEGVEEGGVLREMGEDAELPRATYGQAVRYFRALRCMAGNGQDRSTAVSGYGPGCGAGVTDAGKCVGSTEICKALAW